MELQINQFWILKGDNTFNFGNEYVPDMNNLFYETRV